MNLEPDPRTLDAATAEISELREGSGAEIQAAGGAGRAAVDNGDLDGLALEAGAEAATAEGVVVGVAARGLGVEVGVGEGDDELAVLVELAAGAEAGRGACLGSG